MSDFGHHFLIGLQRAPVLTEHDKRLLSRLRPAGVIVFRDNFQHGVPYAEWLATFGRLIDGVRDCIGRDRILVCIDHEGGGVPRPPAPITAFAAARAWRDQAAAVGRAMGRELASLGVNVNFAPVVDVNSNPDNPVIGQRAFGVTTQEVVEPAAVFLAALQAEGVLGCPKHFPGYGAVSVDSHYDMPVLDLTLDELRARDLVPFRTLARDAETRMIMTAHIVFPRIDPDWPATLSARLIDDVLRREYGYDGIVVSDDLGMGAISRAFDAPEAPVQALRAGTDLLEICAYWTDTARAVAFADHVAASWADGSLSRATLDRSAERIADLLARADQHRTHALAAVDLAAHAGVAPLRRRAEPQSGGGATLA